MTGVQANRGPVGSRIKMQWKETTVTQALIDKARERRRDALLRVKNKSSSAPVTAQRDIKNVFDLPDWSRTSDNVVSLRTYRIDVKMALDRVH